MEWVSFALGIVVTFGIQAIATAVAHLQFTRNREPKETAGRFELTEIQ